MVIHPADRMLVNWAIESGHPFEYVREEGLPEPALRIQLGVSTAFFHNGKLVRWRADTRAEHMDQLMFELTSFFGFCSKTDVYPPQKVFLTEQEIQALRRPPFNKAG
jgi:hypothetical protein